MWIWTVEFAHHNSQARTFPDCQPQLSGAYIMHWNYISIIQLHDQAQVYIMSLHYIQVNEFLTSQNSWKFLYHKIHDSVVSFQDF